MRGCLLVQAKIEGGPPIADAATIRSFNTAAFAFDPVLVNHVKRNPVLGRQHVVDELVRDLFRAQVHELAVPHIRQEEIMHQLAAVPIGQGLDRLEFEDRSSADKHVDIVRFAKAIECHVDGHFDLGPSHAKNDFAMVDFLVKKPAEFVMDGKDIPHRFKDHFAELAIIQPPNLRTLLQLALVLSSSDRKMKDRKIEVGISRLSISLLFIFLSHIFLSFHVAKQSRSNLVMFDCDDWQPIQGIPAFG